MWSGLLLKVMFGFSGVWIVFFFKLFSLLKGFISLLKCVLFRYIVMVLIVKLCWFWLFFKVLFFIIGLWLLWLYDFLWVFINFIFVLWYLICVVLKFLKIEMCVLCFSFLLKVCVILILFFIIIMFIFFEGCFRNIFCI